MADTGLTIVFTGDVKGKPQKLHLILTGRTAQPDVIALADLVTEMRNIKHPYEHGLEARKGIDYQQKGN
jgi:cob(I)alamin adenosyltransferase